MDSIIFDVDGTLWDSTREVAASWQVVCREKGYPYAHLTPERLGAEFGKLLHDIGRAVFPDLPEEEMIALTDACCDYENEYLTEKGPDPYPGVEQIFRTLYAKMPLFIVSNCQAGYIEAFLTRTGLSAYITDHLCPGDTGCAKAANIRAIIDKHHLKSPVYVGDTAGDAQAAAEAGVPIIYASYGFGHIDSPAAVITCPLDLLNIIQ